MSELDTQTRWPVNLFVLHQANLPFLNGESGQLHNSRLTPRERRLLAVIVMVTLVLGGVALYLAARSLHLTEHGVITQAEVIEHGTHFNIPGVHYYVVYSFRASDAVFTGQQAVSEGIYRRLTRRDAVAEVAYLPDDPQVSRLAGDNQIYTETSLAIFGVFAGAFLALAVFIRPYRTRQLARYGQVIVGEIGASRQQGAHIHVRFTFRSPEGRRLEGIGSTNVHLSSATIPEPGVPVAVLYSNENFYRML